MKVKMLSRCTVFVLFAIFCGLLNACDENETPSDSQVISIKRSLSGKWNISFFWQTLDRQEERSISKIIEIRHYGENVNAYYEFQYPERPGETYAHRWGGYIRNYPDVELSINEININYNLVYNRYFVDMDFDSLTNSFETSVYEFRSESGDVQLRVWFAGNRVR